MSRSQLIAKAARRKFAAEKRLNAAKEQFEAAVIIQDTSAMTAAAEAAHEALQVWLDTHAELFAMILQDEGEEP